jgi:hypothetical protein
MKIIYRVILFILFVFAVFFKITTKPDISKKQEKELIDSMIPVHSIQPNDTNFSDLLFLKSVLEDKKVLLLGEAVHNDATTFLAKTRLIKFLHEQLGYDVLLWEAGLFNIWYMNEELKKEKQLTPSFAIYPFWYHAVECKELWDYLNRQQKTSNPIQMGGFDLQHTGTINDTVLGNKIIHFLKEKNIDIVNYRHFNSIVYKIGYIGYPYQWINKNKEEKDSILLDFANILKIINPEIHNFEDSVFYRYLSQAMIWANCTWTYKLGDPKRSHLRDSIMADNLMWLIDQYYPERKVIVWASNLHISYNNTQYQEMNHEMNFVSMGEYLKKKYGNRCYAMVFSSFCHLSDRHTIFLKGSNKSIEYLLHQNKIRYGFLNFRTLPDSSFLHDDITMRVNQNFDLKGKWSSMSDGLFYMDTMRSLHY